MPAVFAVGMQSPFAGDAGQSAATFTGGIALDVTLPVLDGQAVVTAATPTAAITAALVNTVTATVGGQSAGYTPGPDSVGVVATQHLPFVVTAGSTAGQYTLKLEDLSLMPGQTPDWDYNDRIWTITVTELTSPVPVKGDYYTLDEDTVLSVDAAGGVLSNDSQDEGGSVSPHATLDRVAQNGTVVLHSDGSFDYTPQANYSGFDYFTYRASNGLLTSFETVVAIQVGRVQSDEVVAASDIVTTSPGEPVTFDVLANDTDYSNTTLTVIPDTVPAHGVLTHITEGLFSYAPQPGYTGVDSFRYVVTNGLGKASQDTVYINAKLPAARYKVGTDDPTITDDSGAGDWGSTTELLDILRAQGQKRFDQKHCRSKCRHHHWRRYGRRRIPALGSGRRSSGGGTGDDAERFRSHEALSRQQRHRSHRRHDLAAQGQVSQRPLRERGGSCKNFRRDARRWRSRHHGYDGE